MTPRHSFLIAIGTALCASCTLEPQSAPPLMGPSGFATSLTVEAAPDALQTDGISQSRVTVTARDAMGVPLRNLSIHAETMVEGRSTELGTLSARNIFTDASGRAVVIYTAPSIAGREDTGTRVEITIIPAGTNFANAISASTVIRLIPVSR